MRPRLTAPWSTLAPEWDAVVVGSGYGGAVAASRLARAGRSVCVLERGREWRPDELPGTAAAAIGEVRLRGPADVGSASRLWDLRVAPGVAVLSGSGVGGTSLVNAGVILPPDRAVIGGGRWPEALRADVDGVLAGFASFAAFVGPRPYARPHGKRAALERIAAATGFTATALPLELDVEPRTTRAGVPLAGCTGCGDCASGCRVGAKASLDATLLADAVAHGARVYAEAEVDHVARAGDAWVVAFRTGAFVRARTVVLAAGALGSTGILLRSRERGLRLSDALGSSFCGNGNAAAALLDPAERVEALGGRRPPGPCITTALVPPPGTPRERWLHVEDGTVPGVLAAWVHATSGADPVAAVEALVGAGRSGLALLVQAHDGARGRLRLDAGGEVVVDWPDFAATLPEALEPFLRSAASALGARLLRDPLPVPTIVHPLGGAPMGDDATVGVVDHAGRVFDPAGGVHPGLLVCDGAVVPGSLGRNPAGTIAALAERVLAIHLGRGGLRPEGPRLAGPPVPRRRWRLAEGFDGWLADRPADDPVVGPPGPLSAPAEARLVLHFEDWDGFVRDAGHPVGLTGTVACELLHREPLAVVEGRAWLLTDDPDRADTGYNRYRMGLVDRDGGRWLLCGTKVWRPGNALDVWSDGTLLPVEVWRGTSADGPPALRGLLRMGPLRFAQSVRSYHAPGGRWAEQSRGLARFVSFSMARIVPRLH